MAQYAAHALMYGVWRKMLPAVDSSKPRQIETQ